MIAHAPPHAAAPLPCSVGPLWAHVEAEWVAHHPKFQEALDHVTEGQVTLEGLLTWLLEAKEQSHLIQVAIQGMLDHIDTALDEVVVTLGR